MKDDPGVSSRIHRGPVGILPETGVGEQAGSGVHLGSHERKVRSGRNLFHRHSVKMEFFFVGNIHENAAYKNIEHSTVL